jgi:predicted O-methyltransferase YrrM
LSEDINLISQVESTKENMEKITINRMHFSEVAWTVIFERAASHASSLRTEIFQKSEVLDDLRKFAAYNTGSITTGAIWTLFSTCIFFKPKTIAEVGTFIGKSTFSMACALDVVHPEGGEIYTCDFSNNIDLAFGTKTQVKQFPMQSSTNMFSVLSDEKQKCDLLLLDGRLQTDDFKLLSSILHPESIILLDDFEGTEKGVVNALQLMNSLQNTHYLAYPPSRELMRLHGLNEGCTIGMIVPRVLVEHTNQ